MSRCHLWIDADDRVVAAAIIWSDGYVWCQSWTTDDLAHRALDAAAEWGIAPGGRPIDFDDPALIALTWLRALLPLACHGERYDGYPAPFEESIEIGLDEEAYVLDLVAGGLDAPATLTTMTWPTLHIATHPATPRATPAARVRQHLQRDRADREERRRAHVAAQQASVSHAPEPPSDAAAEPAALPAPDGVLTRDEFVTAVLDGAEQFHLHSWADDLLTAVQRSATPLAPPDAAAVADLLAEVIGRRRAAIDPFEGYLEAPPVIIKLHQAHAPAIRKLTEQRNAAYQLLLHDVASQFYATLAHPPTWSALVEHGASPHRPEPPNYDDW